MHLFFFFGQINFLTSRFLRFFEDFINHIFLIGLKYKIVWSITEILCVNTVNSNSLFTHCLRKGRKKELRNSQLLDFESGPAWA